MTVYIDSHPCLYEVRSLAGMFFPGEKTKIVEGGFDDPGEDYIYTGAVEEDGFSLLSVRIKVGDFFEERQDKVPLSCDSFKNECERCFGLMIYQTLEKATGFSPEWGILTGIRPVKLVQSRLDKGIREEEIYREFSEKYLVSPEKIRLMMETARGEKKALAATSGHDFSLYIGIPFCPTRCLYCSFVSHSIEKTRKLIPDYVDKLCEEIRYTAKVAADNNLSLSTIYMGGGTPTALTAAQLRRIFDTVRDAFDISGILEYTVEAGRADTIDREKLQAIKDAGATRISINPQTMEAGVLEKIGRKHTVDQVLESFVLAREVGFNDINMDLIAGLHSDTLEGFQRSVDAVLRLSPENVTIHTLAVKRSSDMVYQGQAIYDAHSGLVSDMLAYAYGVLEKENYLPYYLYRQKNMRDNLENVGFGKVGKIGYYNVYIMEEVQTILACGAGAVSKLWDGSGRLMERIFNYKFPYEYLNGFDTLMKRKQAVYTYFEGTKG